MEEDDKKSPETPAAAPKSAPVKHARPKLSEDRFKNADGKTELPQRTYNYGSKGQLIVVGVLGAILLALFIFMKLHPRHHAQKPDAAAVAPPAQTAPSQTPAPVVPGGNNMPDDVAPAQTAPQFNFHDDP